MNPLFEGAQANDSKDLVNFIVMTLHEELNKASPKMDVPKNNNMFINQTNEIEVFNIFAQNFIQQNQSIISDLFYGVSEAINQCSKFKLNKFNF